MTASRKLYEATAVAHKALEETAFAQRLATGQIGLTAYVDYLRAVAVVVTNLRTAVRRNGTAEQRFMLPTLDEWVTRIGADIKTLAPDDPLTNPDAQAAAHKVTQKLFRTIVDDPPWSFGLAYVMFGSHNGNRSIVKAISAGLGLDGNTGTTYMRATQPGNPVWSRFKEVLDASIDNSDSLESAQRGAIATFDCFHKIFEALDSPDQRQLHSSALNPEAGDHPVPSEKHVAMIADQVGLDAFRAYGYLELRFGQRGESFARSDGAWLTTLGEIPFKSACKKTDWLARLLSARGIPSVCLEHHLTVLHEALLEADALQGDEPQQLLQLSDRVGSRRRALIDDASWEKIARTPVPALDPLGMATLASAVIDQRVGLANCADSIIGWLQATTDLESGNRRTLLALLDSVRG